MTSFAEELIDESLGVSSRRWALLLLAAGIGVVAALWLTGRTRSQAPEAASCPPEPTSARAEHARTVTEKAATRIESVWTRVSRPRTGMRKLPSPRTFRRRTSAEPVD